MSCDNMQWPKTVSSKLATFSCINCVEFERIVLDLELEVMRGLGSILTGGYILSLDFFSCSEDKKANIV